MSNIAQLKERVLEAENRAAYFESLVDAFFSGETPDGANLNHFILAQWGRKRLDEKQNQVAALLRTTT